MQTNPHTFSLLQLLQRNSSQARPRVLGRGNSLRHIRGGGQAPQQRVADPVRRMVTEVQREAQTSASCYAQLNTSILLHSSLHHPELMTRHLYQFPLRDIKLMICRTYPEHGHKKGREGGC